MKKLRILSLLISVFLISTGLLANWSQASAQSTGLEIHLEHTGYIGDTGDFDEVLNYWNTIHSEPFTLEIDAAGGPVSGESWATIGSNMSFMVIYLSFTGNYSGVEDGTISGEIEGWYLAKGFYDMMGQLNSALCDAYSCVAETDFSDYDKYKQPISGTWSGQITGSSDDSGVFSFTVQSNAYDIEKGYNTDPYTMSGTWSATGDMGIATPPPALEELAVPTFITSSSETNGGNTSSVDPMSFFPSAEYPPATSAASPLIPIGGALLGTTLGFWGAGQWGQKPMAVAPSANLVSSPANGQMISPDEARWQAQKLAEGWVWNETNGGFEAVELQHSSSSSPSILASAANTAAAAAKNAPSPLDGLLNSLHQERIDGIRSMMDRHQQNFRDQMRNAEFYNTASQVASTVKTAADYTMEGLAFATGPAGKGIKTMYDTATASVDVVNTIQEEGWVEGVQKAADSAVDILAGHTGKKGKEIKEMYENVKDGVQFANDVKDHGLTTASRNLLTKKVGDKMKDTYLPDTEESGNLTEWALNKAAEEGGGAGIDKGLEQANTLGEDTANYLLSGKPQG